MISIMEIFNNILINLGKALWFYLPVFIANVSIYTIFSVIKLGIPLDLYKTIKVKNRRNRQDKQYYEERIIGHGRDFAGFFFYIFAAVLIGIIQSYADSTQIRAIEALYLGAGGIFGCQMSSFIKRRIGLKQGNYGFFIDQTDFILGSSLFYISMFHLDWQIFVYGIITALILHHLVNLMRNGWERIVTKLQNRQQINQIHLL
ncbi:MAG: CDP-archaeol synthase [Candidatus Woesearchaeota archaeon]